ncbi:hypothetical protein [Planctomicrobium sp. SH664]|uniref:hypothetical protein n=1 Tax=Planctomicrobium sp. SH664 TaxID=3448125 RepID=UPI003F5AE8F9
MGMALSLADSSLSAAEPKTITLTEDFETGADRWEPTDPKAWTVDKIEGNHVYHIHGNSDYKPPYRSPFNISLLKDVVVSDFELTARVKTLQTSRGHRDMCVVFGYQDPANFYYVHLGEKTDPHSNQVMRVQNAPRTMITETNDEGTPWKDDTWHTVKVVRKVDDGLIEIYFDDMEKPRKIAHDKTFGWGRIGLGTFDDLGLWDDLKIKGTSAVEAAAGPKSSAAPALKTEK